MGVLKAHFSGPVPNEVVEGFLGIGEVFIINFKAKYLTFLILVYGSNIVVNDYFGRHLNFFGVNVTAGPEVDKVGNVGPGSDVGEIG